MAMAEAGSSQTGVAPPTSHSQIVEVKGQKEEVYIHPEKGPLIYTLDGNYGYFLQQGRPFRFGPCHKFGYSASKPWTGTSPSQQMVILEQAARKNIALREFKGEAFFENARLPTERQIIMASNRMGVTAEKPRAEFRQAPNARPVLCLFYSGGLDPTQGREQMAAMVAEAKKAGLQHVLVLDYPDTYDIPGQGSEPWSLYVDRLVQELDADPDRRHRPVILLGHSRGATPAMTLAARLGKRVLKVYCLSTGAPEPGKPSPFMWLAMSFRASTDIDLLRWFCSLNPVPLLLGVLHSVESGDMTIEDSPYLREKVGLMKRQYVDAMWPDMERDHPVISAPILAVGGKLDGTISKPSMELWKVWSSAKVKVKFIEAGHMDVTNHTQLFVSDMAGL